MPEPVVKPKCPDCGHDLRAQTRTYGARTQLYPVYFTDLHCDWCGYADYDTEGGV